MPRRRDGCRSRLPTSTAFYHTQRQTLRHSCTSRHTARYEDVISTNKPLRSKIKMDSYKVGSLGHLGYLSSIHTAYKRTEEIFERWSKPIDLDNEHNKPSDNCKYTETEVVSEMNGLYILLQLHRSFTARNDWHLLKEHTRPWQEQMPDTVLVSKITLLKSQSNTVRFCRPTQCVGAAFATATWLSVCHVDVK